MRQATLEIMSGDDSGNITGSAFNMQQAVSGSIVPICGDVTATGTLKVQISNDLVLNNAAPTNWADLPNATSAISSGVGPAIMLNNMAYAYLRVVYTRSSGGTTTLKARLNYLSI